MKYDEFAFFNQQLASMLRDGIPLEGALEQLCLSMQRGELRSELELLGADLKNGTPLATALSARKLPEFYVQMLKVGVQSNDLPGVLLMLADYYQSAGLAWTRLKGLMVYPLLVLVAALALSCFFTSLFSRLVDMNFAEVMGVHVPAGMVVTLWGPPILIGLMLALLLSALLVPAVGRSLRWRLPAFKEAKLSQVASAMWLMLKSGGNLDESLGLVRELEKGTPASPELARWQERLAGGRGKFAEMAETSKTFPPLFLWLVGNAGEDLAGGFRRAADMYEAQATYRTDLYLYAALPFSILVLGGMILCQLFPLIRTLTGWMDATM